MIINDISNLKIQKLTQEQYDTALKNNALDNESVYLTPIEIKDYAFKSDLETKADLIDGKVPLEQLPDTIGIPDNYITEEELEKKGYLTEHQDLSAYAKTENLNIVAISGLYSDLKDIPTEFTPAVHNHDNEYYTEAEINAKIGDINTSLNALDANKASSESVNGLSQSITDLNNIVEKTTNLVTSIESTSTDSQYPSAKAVYDKLSKKQDVLTFDNTPISNSTNPITSGGVKTALEGVIQIAEGKCSTYIFDYYDTLYNVLVGENQDVEFLSSLHAGDIFLVRDLKVPDYWWEPQGPVLMLAQQEYSDIIVDGYGAARVLETTKIDLTGYAKTDDIPTNLSELVSDSTHRLVTDDEKNIWSAKSNFSGDYNDLANKPTIPSAYTHPSTHPSTMITGLATVATSGSYNDLSNKPTIPSSLPANGGNADTVDNKHIIIASSAPTTNDTSVITIVI